MSYSVFRVNNYIKNGMDKDVVDPDGGVNLSKKRKILGVAEVVDPEIIFFPDFIYTITNISSIHF